MSEEDVTIPDEPEVTPEEAEADEVEVEEEDTDAPEAEDSDDDAEESDDESGEEDDSDEEPEEIEFKVGGTTLKVPKGSVPEDVAKQVQDFVNSAESSYTKKFQELSEHRKAVAEAEKAIGGLQKMEQETLNAFSRGLKVKEDIGQLENELNQLRQIDLNAVWQSNPDEARRYSDYIANKQAQIQSKHAELQNITQDVADRERQFSEAEQQELTRRIEHGREYVKRTVKGFDEEKVVAYAISQGVSEQDAKMWGLNPTGAAAFHKAMLYDNLMAEAAKAKKPSGTKPSPQKPVTPIKGKASATAKKPRDKMSTEEWLRNREKELQRKAG